MNKVEHAPNLFGLVRRLEDRPQFMAHVIAVYKRHERLSLEEIANHFSTMPFLLLRLALCKRPDPDSQQFAEQVRELSDYSLVDEVQLANMIRQVDALERLAELPTTREPLERESVDSFSGVLSTARDRNAIDEEAPAQDDDESKNSG